MGNGEGPTIKRRRLRAELRGLREAAGLKQEQVNEEMDWSPAKLMRIETGKVGVSKNDLKALLVLYGVTDSEEVARLVELARQSKQRGWWSAYTSKLPAKYADYIALEAEATELRNFQPLMVPGLVQTEAYARAVAREAALREFTAEEIDARVAVRLQRQEILVRDDPPRLWLVLGEAALRQRVGGPEAMRTQLHRLIETGEQRKVNLQVLPFGTGAHAGMTGSFTILDFPEVADAGVVYLEQAGGDLYLEEPDDVHRYTLMFEHLRGMALGPDESASLIARVADEMS